MIGAARIWDTYAHAQQYGTICQHAQQLEARSLALLKSEGATKREEGKAFLAHSLEGGACVGHRFSKPTILPDSVQVDTPAGRSTTPMDVLDTHAGKWGGIWGTQPRCQRQPVWKAYPLDHSRNSHETPAL